MKRCLDRLRPHFQFLPMTGQSLSAALALANTEAPIIGRAYVVDGDTSDIVVMALARPR